MSWHSSMEDRSDVSPVSFAGMRSTRSVSGWLRTRRRTPAVVLRLAHSQECESARRIVSNVAVASGVPTSRTRPETAARRSILEDPIMRKQTRHGARVKVSRLSIGSGGRTSLQFICEIAGTLSSGQGKETIYALTETCKSRNSDNLRGTYRFVSHLGCVRIRARKTAPYAYRDAPHASAI